MSLSSRCTRRGRCASGLRTAQRAQHAVEMARGAGAALHGEPHRLVEHQHVVVFVQRDRLDEGAVLLRLRRIVARLRRFELERRNAHRLPGFASRAFGCVRLPFTRTSPLRMMRWMWLNDRPGNRASKKRSTRMPDLVGRDGDGLHAGRKMHWLRRGCVPLTACGERSTATAPSRDTAAIGVGRGITAILSVSKRPLTPTLSPHAGRGRAAFRRMLHAQIGLPRIVSALWNAPCFARRDHGRDRGRAGRPACRPPPGWRGPFLPRLMAAHACLLAPAHLFDARCGPR